MSELSSAKLEYNVLKTLETRVAQGCQGVHGLFVLLRIIRAVESDFTRRRARKNGKWKDDLVPAASGSAAAALAWMQPLPRCLSKLHFSLSL